MSDYVSNYDPEAVLPVTYPLTVGYFHGSMFAEPHVYLAQDRGHNDTRIESVRIAPGDIPAVIAALQRKLPIIDLLATLA